MMNKDCPYHYFVELDRKIIFDNISSQKLEEFCNNELHILRTIIYQCCNGKWKPKFKKHQHLQNLKIYRIERLKESK